MNLGVKYSIVHFGRSEMFRETIDLTRRVTTKHLMMKNRKPLQVNGWLATALLVAVTITSSAVAAATGEQFCTHGRQNPVKGDSVACYSDAGCRFANEIGCARISMMAGSKRSLQRAEYRCARPITSDQHSDLQRTAGPTDVPKGDIRIAADFLIRSPRRRGQAIEAAPRGRALEQS